MIRLIFRARSIGANSIEGVFRAIGPWLEEHTSKSVPCRGATPGSIFGNLHWMWRFRRDKIHITGDVHYLALAAGKRCVLTIHDIGSAFTGSWLRRHIITWLWFRLPVMAVRVVTVISEATRNDLLKITPWAANKIRIVPDPYNLSFEGEEKTAMPECPRILHIGTKPNKNLERVISALSGIRCHLVIVGRISEPQMRLAEASGISCENLCDIPLEKLVEEYRRCDIVSFPSTFEGFGMPVIEAQAARRPVLAGDIPVLHDVAGPQGAFFVNPYDTADIRRGLLCLIEDGALRKSLTAAGVENIKRFRPEKIAGMYNQIYTEL